MQGEKLPEDIMKEWMLVHYVGLRGLLVPGNNVELVAEAAMMVFSNEKYSWKGFCGMIKSTDFLKVMEAFSFSEMSPKKLDELSGFIQKNNMKDVDFC